MTDHVAAPSPVAVTVVATYAHQGAVRFARPSIVAVVRVAISNVILAVVSTVQANWSTVGKSTAATARATAWLPAVRWPAQPQLRLRTVTLIGFARRASPADPGQDRADQPQQAGAANGREGYPHR